MRQDVEFDAEGVTLRGWLYTPDGASGPAPTVVMAHGFSAVKEMYLDRFAEAFAPAGLAALVFDNRNFGASDGEPRQEIDPWAQVRDYRHAITYAETRDEVDAGRIGIWGSSYSGGHVLVVGAIDRRVKCVVVPGAARLGARELPRARAGRLHRPSRHGFAADRARPLRRRGARDGARRPRGPARALRAADRRLVIVVHRDRREPRRRRGATRSRCAPSRCSRSTSPAPTCRGSARRRC